MDLNDSFTESLVQRSKARKEYLNTKICETSCTISKKRTALSDKNIVEDLSKRQRLDPDESAKENCHTQPSNTEDSFVPFKVSSNVRGLAALRRQNAADTPKNIQTISEGIHDSKQESKEKEITKNDQVKNYNSGITKLEKKEITRKEERSNFRFEGNITVEPATLPVAARKAIFEKAATLPKTKPSECSFQPKLSIAQRAAMFENVTKSDHQMKPQVKATLPKRFAPYKSIKTSEVSVQKDIEIDSFKKETSNLKFLGHVEETTSLIPTESIHLLNNPSNSNSVQQVLSVENIVSSPQKQILDDIFNLPQQTKNNFEEINMENISTHAQQSQFVSTNVNCPHQLNSSDLSIQNQFSEAADSDAQAKLAENTTYDLPQKRIESNAVSHQFSEAEDSNAQPKLVETTYDLPQKRIESNVSLNHCAGNSIDDLQKQLMENSTADSQLEEVMSQEIVQGKEISKLVNQWKKLSSSSSLGNSNSEGEPSKSSLNTYESDEEHADCESELESEYNAAESMSECNERESITESKTEESLKDPNFTDLDDEAMEQEVFNPVTFSTEAGLLHFDVETDSFPATDDETFSYSEQTWQQKVIHSTCLTDSISLKSAVSEASLCNESTLNDQVKENSQIQTYSSSGSIGTNEVEESSVRGEVTAKGSARNVDSPLVHTVSFYRKQKQGSRSSPVASTKRPHSPHEDIPTQNIQKRIKLLQEDIAFQQTVIGQTSQALNLCHATAKFSCSSEQIEAERLLLIATQKRQAYINEIDSLKSRGAYSECITDGTGTLTITDLQLPLKHDFIASQQKGEISSVHCFLCLIRHGPQLIVTQMVSTSDKIIDGALGFSNHIKLQNLPSDFSIVFEVYSLKTSKENFPHDKKYNIKREHSRIRLNSKSKKIENKLPAISSTGGSNAVRSPSFALIGYTRFTVQNCSKNCFALDKVPFTSPLEGILKVKLHLHAENNTAEKGFLTRFEDVSGYGLWHRLWCSLDSHQLAYWKYPDEEHSKQPMGTIDLRQCATAQVKLVSRDVCARPNTFLLMTVRPMEEGDRNTLVSEIGDNLTTTRHLLCADTKEERIVWCNKLNEALANVRKWDAQALRPAVEKKE